MEHRRLEIEIDDSRLSVLDRTTGWIIFQVTAQPGILKPPVDQLERLLHETISSWLHTVTERPKR